MADNVAVTPGSGATLAADDIGGVLYGRTKIVIGNDGVNGGDVSASNPMPVTGALTDTQLRATAVPVSDGGGSLTVDGTVAVSGSVAVTGTFWQATQPVSAASLPLPTGAASETTLGGVLTTTAFQARTPALGQAAMASSSPVVIASDQSTVPVNQAGVSATGSLGALNATVALSLNGASGWAVDLRGTFVATVTFQGTIDGTNWFTIAVLPAGGTVSVASVTTATAVGAWWGNATGLQQVRATATAYTSGSVTVVLRAMQAAGVVTALVSGATTTPVSGTVTANIGTGSIAAGTNAIGDVGQQYRASATGGASFVAVMSPATPAATVCKASAGRLLGFQLQNSSAAIRSVKFWNTAQGSVTLGTTAALFEVDIPAGGRAEFTLEGGIGFATAITYAVTGAKGLTDNTGTLGVNDVSGALYFA